MSDTLARTIALVRAELERSRAPKTFPDLSDTTTFEGDLRCDVVDMVIICTEVEDAFNVRLPVEVEQCATIGDLADMVERLRKEAHADA